MSDEKSEDDAVRSPDLECDISVIVPIYNTPLPILGRCVQSVLSQTYCDWELILVDDASPNREIAPYLNEISKTDSRIRVIRMDRNGGISRATNKGVAQARGNFLAFLDHDDEITEEALAAVAEAATEPDVDLIYTDQLKIDETGAVIDHFFKPDWSPTYLLGVMYIGHLLVVRSHICRNVGGFLPEYDGVQDYEFVLRASAMARRVVHLPYPLYKWRSIAGSLAADTDAKSNIPQLQARAAQSHAVRNKLDLTILPHPHIPHRTRITPTERSPTPRISIVIPTKNHGRILGECLNSIYSVTDYPDFEVVLVDNASCEKLALSVMDKSPAKRVEFKGKFNFSEACNIGAAASSGDYLLFLNNDTKVIDGNWLRIMAAYMADKNVGVVGPMLIYPDGRVQHAGVVLGARGTADHAMRFFPPDVDGYAGSLACAREVSAVTAACLLLSRQLFERVGGFSTDYAKHYQDVDLCLKVRSLGYRILSIPEPRLIHHESVSRKDSGYDMGDRAILMDRWQIELSHGDPYYNRHLSLERLDYSLSQHPNGMGRPG